MLRKTILVLLAAGILLTSVGIGYMRWKRSHSRLQELHSIDELRERFNADRGKPRLVLLLSPT